MRGALILAGLLLGPGWAHAAPAPTGAPAVWKLWEMTVVDRENKYLPVAGYGPQRKAECLAFVIGLAPYEKHHGVLRWYADLAHPSTWYGCWPTSPIPSEDYDPRDEAPK